MMKRRSLLLLPLFFLLLELRVQAKNIFHLKSPDGKIVMDISLDNQVSWALGFAGQAPFITPSNISLTLTSGLVLGDHPVLKNAKTSAANEYFSTPLYKKAQVHDQYNQLILTFKGSYGLIFRAYDDGVAYRFFTTMDKPITILNEKANFNFSADDKGFFPFANDFRNHDKYTTSFEALYKNIKLSAINPDSLAFLPVLIDIGNGDKAAITEADLEDYPGMYLTGNAQNPTSLHADFAKYPTLQQTGGYEGMNYVVNQRADFIAKTKGTRTFPWRVVIVSTEDKQLANSDMVQKLASPSRVGDVSWIKPGKVAWDWWNNWNISHVDFKAGINTQTYKYYIDFASANKLQYVVLDEGWSNLIDLNQITPAINLPEIISYAKQRNVGIILWSSWYAITRSTDATLSKFAAMGIKGFKIDFIDRDDQIMVSSLYDLAKKAADHHLLVDYHGMYKPTGLQRTFPNILNFEGVKGLENVKWGVKNHPGYDVSIPFIRMLAGPLDYTPGAMRNANQANFRAINDNPMSQGTRTHQLAMYTIFEAPLQMLADNPTAYKKEQESTDFIAAVPTTFDETVALDGKVGQFVSIARRKGSTWFVGAMTNWDPRDLTINCSFLGEGKYKAIIFADGVNADKDATDYKRTEITVTNQDKLNIHMAPGGGWAARFEKE